MSDATECKTPIADHIRSIADDLRIPGARLQIEGMDLCWSRIVGTPEVLHAIADRLLHPAQASRDGRSMREALIAAKLTSPDGTYVQGSTDQIIAALSALPSTPSEPAQRPIDHDTIYLRGWNEGIERAIELLEADGWVTPTETIKPLIDVSMVPSTHQAPKPSD